MVTKPQVIEVPAVAYRPLPAELTKPLPLPAPPPANCKYDGTPIVCVLDALGTIPLYQAFAQQCNDDRARAAQFGQTDGQN